jgi:hypothetical protein
MHPLQYLGIGIMLLAQIWFIVLAFRFSTIWGLLVLFIPFAAIVFLIRNWQNAKWAFWVDLVGLIICFIPKALAS